MNTSASSSQRPLTLRQSARYEPRNSVKTPPSRHDSRHSPLSEVNSQLVVRRTACGLRIQTSSGRLLIRRVYACTSWSRPTVLQAGPVTLTFSTSSSFMGANCCLESASLRRLRAARIAASSGSEARDGCIVAQAPRSSTTNVQSVFCISVLLLSRPDIMTSNGGRLSPAATLVSLPNEHGQAWRLHAVVEALQALRGVHCTVAVTMVAEIGDLTRFDTPRELMKFLGLIPSAYSSGERRQQGAITKAGNTHARRALVEGAWAYRYPAKVSRHLQLRLEKQPKIIQDISWKAQVRLCKRYRHLVARGKHANIVTVAIARELAGFMWAIAKQLPVAA